MKLLIFEYFSGGGAAAGELSGDLLREGALILSTLLRDFAHLSGVVVKTALDRRVFDIFGLDKQDLEEFFPAAECWIFDSPVNRRQEILELFEGIDTLLIMAPEKDGILSRLTQMAEEKGITILSPAVSAVRTAGDKWQTYQLLNKAGYLLPRTISSDRISLSKILNQMTGLRAPMVMKPADGVGSDLLYFESYQEFFLKWEKVYRYQGRRVLVQEYINGIPVSVSSLSNGHQAAALSLNLQEINDPPDLSYQGGTSAWDHPAKEEIFSLINGFPAIFPGLKGYFGVDLIISDRGIYLIEINPRITSSIIGLCQSLGPGKTARLITDAVIDKKLPGGVKAVPCKFRIGDFKI